MMHLNSKPHKDKIEVTEEVKEVPIEVEEGAETENREMLNPEDITLMMMI